jgi:type VI secretion system secreted protein VgrG
MKCYILLPIVVSALTVLAPAELLHAQGTAFTYQGGLNDGAIPANGKYDLRFSVYDSTNNPGNLVAGPITNSATGISNGLFAATLDFGVGVFDGNPRWLDIGVRTNGGTNFTTLIPRQALTPSPYAITSGGIIVGGVTSSMLASGAVTGDKIAAGAVTTQSIDDGGAAAYQGFQQAEQGIGGDTTLTFANLLPAPAGSGAAFSLTVNGSAFGTVVGFSGYEGISQPYYFVVEVSSPSATLNPDAELGLSAQLNYSRSGRVTTFDGLVTGCALSGSDGTSFLYSVRIESPLAYLALKADYRIFQSMTAPAVASSVYQTITGSSPISALGTYSVHNSLTQYGETSFKFISRLMEEEGIFYFFNHNAGAHQLVLGDNTAAYLAAPNSPFPYYGNTKTNIPGGEYIRSFQKASHQSTLGSTVNSYNLATPGASLLASNNAAEGLQEQYEFGNDVQTLGYDQQLAGARSGRQTVERMMLAGSATAPDLRPGYTFTLNDQSGAGVGGSYVVAAVHHAGFLRVTNGASTLFYGNEFQAVPASVIFRPPVVTPKPKAPPSAAVVTGPPGEEIFTDKYGRVKVQFHWDRYGASNDTSSAWLRVGSPLAGSNGRGVIFLPRVGDEVLVSFLEGDPDQPLVIGSVYNASNLPPYALPAGKNISTIRSTGTPAQPGQVNEIKFDDTVGSQALSVLAAKDLNVSAAAGTLSLQSSQTIITGNVGINEANPAGPLHITGPTSAPPSSLPSADNGLVLGTTGTSGYKWIQSFGGSLVLNATGNNVGIGNSAPTHQLVVGNSASPAYCDGTTWQNGSDRDSKEQFTEVNPLEVLDRLSSLPISKWNYKAQGGEIHLGPMAQDFHAAFGLNGNDDKHISTVDEGGVALAAIQGLNQKVEGGTQKTELEIQRLKIENAELKTRLEKLEQLIAGNPK